MKLQPHHIAPYLPFELKIIGNTHGYVKTLSGLHNEDVYVTEQNNTRYGAWADLTDIKLILRPLDLTKPITVDGIEIFPIVEILHQYNSLLAGGEPYTEKDLSKNPMYWEYWAVEKLFEWHFDVFGLIEQGLAVELT